MQLCCIEHAIKSLESYSAIWNQTYQCALCLSQADLEIFNGNGYHIFGASVTRCMTSKNDMSMCLFTFIESLARFVFPIITMKRKNILTTRFRHSRCRRWESLMLAVYNIFYVARIDDGYGIKRNPNMAMVKWWSANCQCLLFFFICFEGWKYFPAS